MKMKIFYKELKNEIKQDDINTSGSEVLSQKGPKNTGPNGLYIFDANAIDDLLEEHRQNPTLLEGGMSY